jgi:hypothetical protein
MIIGKGIMRYWEKSCPSATLFTTNPTWAALELKPGLHSEKPVTNNLSYGIAKIN